MFDGKYFISSGEIRDGVLLEWISIIGTQEEADKYRATLTLASPKFKVNFFFGKKSLQKIHA